MKSSLFLAVCMNPTLQKTLVFPGFYKDTVNRTGDYRFDASGKGINVCRVLNQLNKKCCHLTQLGGSFREIFLGLCSKDGLTLEWVESNSSIRFCYTLLDTNEKSVTELVEEAEEVEKGTEERLLKAFSALVPKCSTLIISGTKAAGFSGALVPEMVKQGKAQGSKVILDIRGNDLLNSLPFMPDIVKPNLFEFISTFEPRLISHNKINGSEEKIREKTVEIMAEIYNRFKVSFVLTRGADSVWYSEKGKLVEYNFEPVEPVNTTGSGDAFTAGLAAALEEGAAIHEAVIMGTECGAKNASLLRPGVIK